jgi:hypothetical protein
MLSGTATVSAAEKVSKKRKRGYKKAPVSQTARACKRARTAADSNPADATVPSPRPQTPARPSARPWKRFLRCAQRVVQLQPTEPSFRRLDFLMDAHAVAPSVSYSLPWTTSQAHRVVLTSFSSCRTPEARLVHWLMYPLLTEAKDFPFAASTSAVLDRLETILELTPADDEGIIDADLTDRWMAAVSTNWYWFRFVAEWLPWSDPTWVSWICFVSEWLPWSKSGNVSTATGPATGTGREQQQHTLTTVRLATTLNQYSRLVEWLHDHPSDHRRNSMIHPPSDIRLLSQPSVVPCEDLFQAMLLFTQMCTCVEDRRQAVDVTAWCLYAMHKGWTDRALRFRKYVFHWTKTSLDAWALGLGRHMNGCTIRTKPMRAMLRGWFGRCTDMELAAFLRQTSTDVWLDPHLTFWTKAVRLRLLQPAMVHRRVFCQALAPFVRRHLVPESKTSTYASTIAFKKVVFESDDLKHLHWLDNHSVMERMCDKAVALAKRMSIPSQAAAMYLLFGKATADEFQRYDHVVAFLRNHAATLAPPLGQVHVWESEPTSAMLPRSMNVPVIDPKNVMIAIMTSTWMQLPKSWWQDVMHNLVVRRHFCFPPGFLPLVVRLLRAHPSAISCLCWRPSDWNNVVRWLCQPVSPTVAATMRFDTEVSNTSLQELLLSHHVFGESELTDCLTFVATTRKQSAEADVTLAVFRYARQQYPLLAARFLVCFYQRHPSYFDSLPNQGWRDPHLTSCAVHRSPVYSHVLRLVSILYPSASPMSQFDDLLRAHLTLDNESRYFSPDAWVCILQYLTPHHRSVYRAVVSFLCDSVGLESPFSLSVLFGM